MNDEDSNFSNITVVGFQSTAMFNNCFIFGDNLEATQENTVLCGETLFGRAIPDDVRELVETQTGALNWVITAISVAVTRQAEAYVETQLSTKAK